MSKPRILELVPLWRRQDGSYSSPPVMDDRVQDLVTLMQSGPVKLLLKPAEKRSPKAPDAHLLAIAIDGKGKR